MEKFITATGKTIDLAIEAALAQLGLERDDVSVQVLAQAKAPVKEPEEEDQAVENTALFQMRQRILDLLSGLSEEDAKLLTLRFGLEGGKPMNPQQIGDLLQLTAEEVLQREARALQILRNEN